MPVATHPLACKTLQRRWLPARSSSKDSKHLPLHAPTAPSRCRRSDAPRARTVPRAAILPSPVAQTLRDTFDTTIALRHRTPTSRTNRDLVRAPSTAVLRAAPSCDAGSRSPPLFLSIPRARYVASRAKARATLETMSSMRLRASAWLVMPETIREKATGEVPLGRNTRPLSAMVLSRVPVFA